MAELEKAPTIPEGMVPKVLKALDAGLMPGTTEYHEALGSSAKSRGLTPSAHLPPIISGLRDRFSREAQSLYKEQQSLDAVGSEILKVLSVQEATLKAHQDFAARNAPPRSLLQQSYGQQAFPTPMVPGLSEPQPAYGPGAPMQAHGPGSPMPDPYWNDSPQLQQALLEQGQGRMEGPRPMVEGPQPMARNAVMMPDANAPLHPWEVGRMQRLQAGHTVMGENGQEIPTALARPHGDSLTAEQANQIQDDMRATWEAAGIPAEKQPKLGTYKAGSVISRAAFDTKMRETNDFLQKAGYQTTTKSLDDVSVSITGKLFSELNPDALVTAKDRQRASEHGVQLPARKDLTQREAVGLVKNYGLPLLLAGAKAEATTKARESVESDIRLTGPTMIMDELSGLVDKLFLPESAGLKERGKHAISLRGRLAVADPDVVKWNRVIQRAMRPQLARAEGEVGNLAAQEQLNAGELVPDLMGGTTDYFPFIKLPDTKETAIARLKLATEFITLGSKAPNGERETSAVQQKLKSIKQNLDALDNKVAKAANKDAGPLGDLTKEEFEYARNLASQGVSKERATALIRERRGLNGK